CPLQPNAIERKRTVLRKSPPPPVPGRTSAVTRAMPALLVGLTALVTGAMIHAGFGLWWVLENHLFRAGAAYDWTGALAASGTATTIVLIVGLLARRLVATDRSSAALAPALSAGTVPVLGADR